MVARKLADGAGAAPRIVATTDRGEALDGAELVAGARSEAYSDTIAAGNVVSQDPAAGQMVDKGSAVSYVVSDGIEQVTVPDLEGPAADAEAKITDAGLTVGATSNAFSDTVAAGDVIRQDPAAGSMVDRDSTVSYVASLGIEPGQAVYAQVKSIALLN